ncbi:Coenzyme F420 hydrogenase/dehydrogenase, beta subunit C-terminal domain [Clostridium sp. Marseille-P2415]|uniref:Coenzyme F420 hydrogenase/dehydrogenase, beta subunit C-terminal domain n=1 Tax=Clostridium sp. Marseille-P2415 TaxID=1805471 RepID=UPI0009888039|nr:Coenzyme F420 hydrogenase/dehydrogenase, beta subunit C-terminal domain [Clostridium sp. Marseille-P2415]
MDNIKVVGKACVGCRSCEQSCPVKCIRLRPNQEGFLYPDVDEQVCLSCGVCLKKCPAFDFKPQGRKPVRVLGFKSNDRERILQSASGGASDLFARFIIQAGGSVYGCAYTENLEARHIKVDKIEDLYRLQSSKYVQSDLKYCYDSAKSELDKGKLVLFTGTPCQIGGLYKYLGNLSYDNLFTVDIICHGVPSPELLRKYFAYQEKKLGEELKYFNFRSKEKRGWGTQYLLKTKTKTKTNLLSLDKYGKHFMDGDCYRECCYECSYANTDRVGDITIGDFWGVEKSNPGFASISGVSAVLINSEQGNKLFERVESQASVIETELEAVLLKQGNLQHPTVRPACRDDFYEGIQDENFIENLKVGVCMKERLKTLMSGKLLQLLKSEM